MAESSIIECDLAFPNLADAVRLVPADFADGYRWFQVHQGETMKSLPYGRGRPDEVA